MKQIILSILLLASLTTYSQCVSKDINTNPSAPVNNELPSKTNTFFDWTKSVWESNNTCNGYKPVESPFYKIDNLERLRKSKDMKPEDGWELIRRYMGLDENNKPSVDQPEHTYVILYNKYSGILRTLFKVCRGEDYNGIQISIQFYNPSFQTSLLDYNSTARALDDFEPFPSAQSASPFINEDTKWFYADFPMVYDPCTCNNKTTLSIITKLIELSDIKIEGTINGTLTTIQNGKGTVEDDGLYMFKNVAKVGDKFKKGYNNVDDFISETKKVAATLPNSASILSALDKLQGGLKNNQLLKTGLAAVPWIQKALGLIDFFTGGGSSAPQTVQIMPMAVNLNAKLSGTISTSNVYHDIKFSNPGTQEAPNDPDVYPYYNEILGVFNLMKTPTFCTSKSWILLPQSYFQGGIQKWNFTLKDNLFWVLNSASDLVLQDGQIAYVAQSLNNSTTPPSTLTPPFGINNAIQANTDQGFFNLEGKDMETGFWEYRTDYVDMKCLGRDHGFTFSRHLATAQQDDMPVNKFYIKLILNLKHKNNPALQNVLLVLKFPIKLDFTCSGYNSGKFNPALCNGGAVKEATISEVSNFCKSNEYTTNRTRTFNQTSPFALNKIVSNISIYPNPAKTSFTIKNNEKNTVVSTIQILNSTGNVCLYDARQIDGNSQRQINVSTLVKGIYFVKAIYSTGKTDLKRLIIQ